MDVMGKADPYVVITMKKTETRNKTRVVNDSLNPVWNQTFDIVVEDGLHDMLIFEVNDHDTFGKNYIGRCIMTLTRVILEGEVKDSFPLEEAKSGKIISTSQMDSTTNFQKSIKFKRQIYYFFFLVIKPP